jgi:hypothetical protein
MSRTSRSVSSSWRSLAVILLAGALLAGCGARVVARPQASGVPSLSLAVPLRTVACTTSDACLALGTSGSATGPPSVAEDRLTAGGWRALATPDAVSTLLTSSSCWSDGCLVGGSQPARDVTWRYSAARRQLILASSPAGGRGVLALSCYAAASCAMFDSSGVTGAARISFSTDGGGTWSTPLAAPWSTGESVTALACTDGLDCLAAQTNAVGAAVLEATHDAGATWSPAATQTGWRTVTSLKCQAVRCEALAFTFTGPEVIRTSDFGRAWRTQRLLGQAAALSCVSYARCVVVGQDGPSAWAARLATRSATALSLRYVPSPLLEVACGTKVCAAIGVSTLVVFRP